MECDARALKKGKKKKTGLPFTPPGAEPECQIKVKHIEHEGNLI